MRLTILSIAYPLAPVLPDAIGGAEHILARLDAALVAHGHHSIVVACAGSCVAGTLISFPEAAAPFHDSVLESAEHRTRIAIDEAMSRWSVDLVHIHALDYEQLLPPPGVPVLATLHLPREFYSSAALRPTRPDTWLQCVSRAQHRTMEGYADRLLTPIENGVAIPPRIPHAKRTFALTLGRICPEKGMHLAIDASRRAGIPLVIGGRVYPYPAHEHYFDTVIQPRLGDRVHFVGPLRGARKARYLAAARCVVIASIVAETSSLLAREALAAGTPVVAFRRGALVDVIEDGVTGFLVDNIEEMADAMRRCEQLKPERCRAYALHHFSEDHMITAYFSVYEQLSGRRSSALAIGL